MNDKGIIEHGGRAVKPLAPVAMFRHNSNAHVNHFIRLAIDILTIPNLHTDSITVELAGNTITNKSVCGCIL